MTLDEAIEERQKVIEVQEKLYEEASTNESKEIIKSATDNDRQLVEWLRELKDLREENKVLTSECDRLIKEKGELLSEVSGSDVLRICQLENQLQVELDNSHCLEIELTEAKKLLKAAVEDIHDVLTSQIKITNYTLCEKCKHYLNCNCKDKCIARYDLKQWRFADIALKLIGETNDEP